MVNLYALLAGSQEKLHSVVKGIFVIGLNGLQVWFLKWLMRNLIYVGGAVVIVVGFSCSSCSVGGTRLRSCCMTGHWGAGGG